MKPAAFTYERPATVEEAVSVLAAHDGEAKLLAGGQSLIPMMNFRLATPQVLVDIGRIDELTGVEVSDGRVRLGALVTHQRVAASSETAAAVPIAAQAAGMIGHLAIRNRGTVGGSLAHSDPAAEWPLLVRLLDAEITLRGPNGPRVVDGASFNTGFFETALAADEVLTGVSLPVREPGEGWGFVEFARRHGDFALAMVGATLKVTSDGVVSSARICLGSVGPTPLRARAAEEALVGRPATDECFAEAARTAAGECQPGSDVHASADYRRRLVRTLTERALAQVRLRTAEAAASGPTTNEAPR